MKNVVPNTVYGIYAVCFVEAKIGYMQAVEFYTIGMSIFQQSVCLLLD